MIDIVSEPTGAVYHALVSYAFEQCEEFLLVTRNQLSIEDSAKAILRALKPWQSGQVEASAWPGTELLDRSKAPVYYFRCRSEAASILQTAVNGLYGWQQPQFPEDLCFLKPGRRAWLVSIAHERDAYFDCDQSLLTAIQSHVPNLDMRARPR